MAVIDTKLDPRDAAFAQNRDAMAALVADLRAKVADESSRAAATPRARSTSRAASCCRASASARCSIRAARSSSSRNSPRTGCTTTTIAAAGIITGVGRVSRSRMRDRLQRRDGQGRHLLPDDGEEAPAGAGDRAREPPAVHLPRRLRRREPAEPDRRVPRPRPLRPHLLQPGDDVGGGHPAGRRRDGLVHGGRRVRAGDVGRVDHRQASRARSSSAARRW